MVQSEQHVQAGAGRPKLTWKKLTEKDCHEWKLTTVDHLGPELQCLLKVKDDLS